MTHRDHRLFATFERPIRTENRNIPQSHLDEIRLEVKSEVDSDYGGINF